MAAGKELAVHVTVANDDGELHTFGPDSNVPAWAVKKISNPDVWVDADESSGSEDGDGDEPVDYTDSEWTKAKLEAEVEQRNEGREDDDLIEVEAPGNKAELIAALQADDAAQG